MSVEAGAAALRCGTSCLHSAACVRDGPQLTAAAFGHCGIFARNNDPRSEHLRSPSHARFGRSQLQRLYPASAATTDVSGPILIDQSAWPASSNSQNTATRSDRSRESLRHAIVSDVASARTFQSPKRSHMLLSKYVGGVRDVEGVAPLVDVQLFCAQTKFCRSVRNKPRVIAHRERYSGAAREPITESCFQIDRSWFDVSTIRCLVHTFARACRLQQRKQHIEPTSPRGRGGEEQLDRQ